MIQLTPIGGGSPVSFTAAQFFAALGQRNQNVIGNVIIIGGVQYSLSSFSGFEVAIKFNTIAGLETTISNAEFIRAIANSGLNKCIAEGSDVITLNDNQYDLRTFGGFGGSLVIKPVGSNTFWGVGNSMFLRALVDKTVDVTNNQITIDNVQCQLSTLQTADYGGGALGGYLL